MSNLIFAESAMDCIAAIFVREADVGSGSLADLGLKLGEGPLRVSNRTLKPQAGRQAMRVGKNHSGWGGARG